MSGDGRYSDQASAVGFDMLPKATLPSVSRALSRRNLSAVVHNNACEASVSVVIPCYNYAPYLPQAVGSVLSQSGVAVDVVIVDDASTDESLTVANALAEGEPRVQVLSHSRNAGPVQTFNDGLARARGEFLVRLDADDLLTPGSLARSVAVMRSYPTVGLVYGHPLHFSGPTLPAARTKPTHWTIWPGREWLRDRCRDGWNVITSPEVLMRSSVVEQVGGQKHLDHTHDMEMWFRLSAYADVAYIHGTDQAWHREHANSLSALKVDTYRDLVERRQAFDVLFSTIGSDIPKAGAYRSAAMSALAAQALEFACRELDHGRNDPVVINAFIDFARSTVPTVEALPGWRGLARRMARGVSQTAWYPGSILARAGRRWRRVVRERRWHRQGVY